MVAAQSRRDWLRVAGISVVGGASGLLAACGNGQGPDEPAKTGPADVDLLNHLLDIEYQTAAAYRTGLPVLRGSAQSLGKHFLAQEEEQARALADAIKGIGGTPGPRSEPRGFPPRPTQGHVLDFARILENVVVGVYVNTIPKITDDGLRGLAAALMTTGAEHVMALRLELDPNAHSVAIVPNPS